VANSKQQTSAVSKQQPAPQAKQPAQPVKEKPSLPVINEQNLQHYYAEPLPSFRDVPPSEKQLLFVQKLHLCSFTFALQRPYKACSRERDQAADAAGARTTTQIQDRASSLRQFQRISSLCSARIYSGRCLLAVPTMLTTSTQKRRNPRLSPPGHTCRSVEVTLTRAAVHCGALASIGQHQGWWTQQSSQCNTIVAEHWLTPGCTRCCDCRLEATAESKAPGLCSRPSQAEC